MNVVEINNLTKDFGNHKGIFDLSFSLKQGEVVGFLGSNGAGKTTTIRHLMGFIKPESGSAKILDMDCFRNASSVQEKIGYLPGEIAFMDNMTGEAFIQFMAEMKNMRNMHYARELVDYFSIDTQVKIKKMSKGMKQKIGLIIAFMQNAPILILDEPTTGLDPLMQSKFVELIKKEKSKGKTILMSSHIFEEIENTCERIVMIKEGQIVADKNINTIKEEMSKHYEITFSNIEDAVHFQKQYPENSTRKENIVCLLSKENINLLLSELCKYNIKDINALAESMPQFFNAFGMGNPGTTLLDFLNNYLYGFILILIPFLYTIIMCYKLVAKYIDKGSMAYLLNTHSSRTEIILTQFTVLLTGLLVLVLYSTGLIVLISEIMFKGDLEISKFLLLNAGLLILEIFLSALYFMFACLFDELKFSVGLGAGLGMIFFLLQMLSEVSEDIEFLKYLTPLTLFDPEGLIKYETESFIYLAILWVTAIIFTVLTTIKFKKRDLSL